MRMDRRNFLRGAAGAGCTLAFGLKFFHFSDDPEAYAAEVEQLVRSTCSPNCTGACGFNARITDGRISTLIQAADYPEDSYNPRGCLRGLSMMDLIYGKDRLKYPLIRTGPRGSGQFRRATWDEALNYAAGKLKEITEKYGPEAIASTIQVPGAGYVQKGARLLSSAAAMHSMTSHSHDDEIQVYRESPLIISFAPLIGEIECARRGKRAVYPLSWIRSSSLKGRSRETGTQPVHVQDHHREEHAWLVLWLRETSAKRQIQDRGIIWDQWSQPWNVNRMLYIWIGQSCRTS